MEGHTHLSILAADLIVSKESRSEYAHLSYLIENCLQLSSGVPLIPKSSDVDEFIESMGFTPNIVEDSEDAWKVSPRIAIQTWTSESDGNRLHTGFSVTNNEVTMAYLARHDLGVEFENLKGELDKCSPSEEFDDIDPPDAVSLVQAIRSTEAGDLLNSVLANADSTPEKVEAVANNSDVESMLESVHSSFEIRDEVRMSDHYGDMRAGKGWMVGGPQSGKGAEFVVLLDGRVLLDQNAFDGVSDALTGVRNLI